jgi:hypothetical protein
MRKLHTLRRVRTKFLKSQYGSGNPIHTRNSQQILKINFSELVRTVKGKFFQVNTADNCSGSAAPRAPITDIYVICMCIVLLLDYYEINEVYVQSIRDLIPKNARPPDTVGGSRAGTT